jgi:hypothetical protein
MWRWSQSWPQELVACGSAGSELALLQDGFRANSRPPGQGPKHQVDADVADDRQPMRVRPHEPTIGAAQRGCQ